jgi:hypothetical protein
MNSVACLVADKIPEHAYHIKLLSKLPCGPNGQKFATYFTFKKFKYYNNIHTLFSTLTKPVDSQHIQIVLSRDTETHYYNIFIKSCSVYETICYPPSRLNGMPSSPIPHISFF